VSSRPPPLPPLFPYTTLFRSDPGAGDRVILIFDEAQGLSDEILEQLLALSKLTGNGGQSLQIVLVGQLDLEARLNAPRYQALRRSEEHTSELQSLTNLVCRLL